VSNTPVLATLLTVLVSDTPELATLATAAPATLLTPALDTPKLATLVVSVMSASAAGWAWPLPAWLPDPSLTCSETSTSSPGRSLT
jgi:hypothetical protein